jgi:hypothetical protein
MAGKSFATVIKLAIASSMVLAGAVAGQAASAAEPAASAAKKDKSKRVCKSITRAGTRLPTRLCLSQEEWDIAMRNVQDGVLAHQKRNTSTSPMGAFEGNPR